MPIPPSEVAAQPKTVQPIERSPPNIDQVREPPDASPEAESDQRLRALRERIETLITRLSMRRDGEEKSAPKPCDNADELRRDVDQALADCGYGRADIAPIAEAAIDLVDVALMDDASPGMDDQPTGSIYRLRAFEIAIATDGADADRTFRAGIAPVGADHRRSAPGASAPRAEIPQRRVKRVALRGARRSLLQGGGEIVRLRFTAVTV
jgi:hypothetical protein